MHPSYPRTRSLARTHTQTHTAPKFRFSVRGGWGRGGSKGCPDNRERKSKCQGLRVYLAGGCWGREGDLTAPDPGRASPASYCAVGGVSRFSPNSRSLLSSLPPSRFFFSTFSSLLVSPSSAHCLPPPFTPLSGPEGTSDFFLHQVGVIHIKHFTTTHQEK